MELFRCVDGGRDGWKDEGREGRMDARKAVWVDALIWIGLE